MFLFSVVFCQIIVRWRFGVVVKGLLLWLFGLGNTGELGTRIPITSRGLLFRAVLDGGKTCVSLFLVLGAGLVWSALRLRLITYRACATTML